MDLTLILYGIIILVIGVLGLRAFRQKSKPARGSVSAPEPLAISTITDYFSTPESFKMTCLRTGIISSLRDPTPVPTIVEKSDNKLVIDITPPRGGDLHRLRSRVEQLASYMQLDEQSLRFENSEYRTRMVVDFSLAEFYQTTKLWTPDLAVDPKMPELAPLGVNIDGDIAYGPVADTHVLVAGQTGSGKGSVLWSYLNPFAGRDDTVIWGVDLKWGREMRKAPQIFDRVAQEQEEFATLIDDLYDVMVERAENENLANFKPSRDNPRIILAIDEAKDISKMNTQKEYNSARKFEIDGEMYEDDSVIFKWESLLTKSRAMGITIIACIQDPTKANFKWASDFPTRIGLKLTVAQQITALGNDSYDYYDLSTVGEVKGLALVRGEDGNFSLVKCFYSTPEILSNLPARVCELSSGVVE